MCLLTIHEGEEESHISIATGQASAKMDEERKKERPGAGKVWSVSWGLVNSSLPKRQFTPVRLNVFFYFVFLSSVFCELFFLYFVFLFCFLFFFKKAVV